MDIEEIMTGAYWRDSHRAIYNKDCRSMGDLSDECVQMVVTSPPYWGLRKYAGLPDLIWGGEEECEHRWQIQRAQSSGGTPSNKSTLRDEYGAKAKEPKQQGLSNNLISTAFCSLCGAWKGAYGLEPTPEMYVQHTIEILREVRRVLRKDGVFFLNIGDSYFGSNSGAVRDNKSTKATELGFHRPSGGGITHKTIKAKDLCLIPFRVAIAAQEDGWWVRSVIIWNKPNPMPESVTDRPTESHEYILLLTKASRYYWDAEAVREPHTRLWNPETNNPGQLAGIGKYHSDNYGQLPPHGFANEPNPAGRNLRSVWTFSTQPYKEAHFATYPEKLVEICVKAATPEVGCCSKCGAPWVRITEKGFKDGKYKPRVDEKYSAGSEFMSNKTTLRCETESETLGWQPQCKCNADKVPSIVLDPFCGSGTTLKVAAELNRRAIGYELSEQYCKLAVKRNKQSVMGKG